MSRIFESLSKLWNLNEAAPSRQDKLVDSQKDIQDPRDKEDVNEYPEGIDMNKKDTEKSDEVETDSDYLNVDEPIVPDSSAEAMTENARKKHLFILMKSLLSYSDHYVSSIETVDAGLLDFEVAQKTRIYLDKIYEIADKLRVYLNDIFNSETLERSIYTYVLLRTEFLTIVDTLNSILGLDDLNKK